MPDESFPRILAVAGIIINERGQVLLTWRDEEPAKRTWQVTAGFVRPGERMLEAMTRQVADKVGITKLKSIEFTGKFYDDPNRNPDRYCLPLLFKVFVANDVAINTQTKYQWFEPKEIPSLPMAFDNKQMLVDAQVI